MTPRRRRLGVVLLGLAGLGVAAWLALGAFSENLVFYFSPTQVVAGEAPVTRSLRIGGLVEGGSLRRGNDDLTTYFSITDMAHSVPVVYTGLLPDLFKEGRGGVVEGRVGPDGVFHATQVLAKHDENYMPVEAARSLEEAQGTLRRTGRNLRDE